MKLIKQPRFPRWSEANFGKTEKGHVEIMEVGKTPDPLPALSKPKSACRTSLGRIRKWVQDYLREHQAKLVKNARLEKAKA